MARFVMNDNIITIEIDREEMARRGKIGGLKKASLYPPHELTKHARSAFLARFERDVDPDGTLDDTERLRRAQAARKAYFAQLARKSAQTRRNRA